MSDFPAAEFRLDGDPAAIRSSASRWSSFGHEASDAATQIRSLDTSLFIGPEGDQYRQGLNDSLPPHLETTGAAYTKVAGALSDYASTLSGLQDRMRPLAAKAPALWQAVQAAQGRLTSARAADQQHAHTQAVDAAARPAGEPAPPDNYRSVATAANTSLSQAHQAWNDCLAAARAVKTDLRTAVDRCTGTIHHAADTRFKHNPHGFGALVAGFKDFVKDHVAGLAKLSGVLKLVSGIAGVLSFIPVIGEVALPIALIAGGAALAIDASIKFSTGQGSWTSITIDAALLALPGVGKLAGAGIKALRGVKAADALATDGRSVGNFVTDTNAAAVNRVKLRAGTKRAIYADAERGSNGEDLLCGATGDTIPCVRAVDGSAIRINAETGKLDPRGTTVPQKGTFHFGHTPGNEWRTYKVDAEARGLNRAQVIEEQNNPNLYRLETPAANLSHQYEGS